MPIFFDISRKMAVRGPAELLSTAVFREVQRTWSATDLLRRIRTADWEEVALAARYFYFRKRTLEAFLGDYQEMASNIKGTARLAELVRNIAPSTALAFLTVLWGINLAGLLLYWRGEVRWAREGLEMVSFALLQMVIGSQAVLFAIDRRESPAHVVAEELAQITEFSREAPASLVFMMENAEAAREGIPAADRELASIRPDHPVMPPGITELALSKNEKSLDTISRQLKTTRVIDISMTIGSFVAFIATVALTLWEQAVAHNTGMVVTGAAGSGLLGLFSFYSTARARTSQIALALFESLVAELRLDMDAASKMPEQDRTAALKAAWRGFRRELMSLYELERKSKDSAAH